MNVPDERTFREVVTHTMTEAEVRAAMLAYYKAENAGAADALAAGFVADGVPPAQAAQGAAEAVERGLQMLVNQQLPLWLEALAERAPRH